MEYTTVAAAPGYFAIGLDADNISEYRLPVIAWRVPLNNGWSTPVTPAGDEMTDLDFTVDRRTEYEAGSKRWFELSGMYKDRRIHLDVRLSDT